MDKNHILELRKNNKLHPAVEQRLKEIFDKAAPGSFTLKEGYGVTSGRTDTTTFTAKGKIIHVEIIASESMVYRDVTNLHQTSADLAITVLMDEKYDSKVSEAYFRANTKHQFPVIMISDVLSFDREQYVLGRIDELLQGLERQIENIDNIVQTRFNEYITKLLVSEAKYRTIHLGIFPRCSLNLLGNEDTEDNLFHKFEPLGIQNAADPFKMIAGMDWRFSHEGQYFVVKEPAGNSDIFTQIAFGNRGDMIFSYVDDKNRLEEIYASGIPEIFEPTLNFAKTVYESKNYDGIVDVVAYFSGLMSKNWKRPGEENNPLSGFLNRRVFYDDKVIMPRKAFTLEELRSHDKRKEFYTDMYIRLQRNTRKIPVR